MEVKGKGTITSAEIYPTYGGPAEPLQQNESQGRNLACGKEPRVARLSAKRHGS